MRGRFVSEKSAVIFGAGKTGRGFIAHLLTLSGYRLTFVEKLPALVKLLRERASYNVRIMGSPDKDIVIAGFETLGTDEVERVAGAIAAAEVVFVSIGGPNLPQIAPQLAAGVRAAHSAGRTTPLNIILCENYFQPGRWLRALISEQLRDNERDWFHRNAGIVEALVLRSTVDPPEEAKAADPLSLNSQDTWEMPADREAFVGEIPAILWLAPKEGFQSGLIRKLYTYNSVNAVISYMGYMKGYAMLSEAANDPDIAEAAREAAREAGEALARTSASIPKTSAGLPHPRSPTSRIATLPILSSGTRATPSESWPVMIGWSAPRAWLSSMASGRLR